MDHASDNVINSWVEGLTGKEVASYMRGWGVGDFKVVATQLAHALKKGRAKSPEGLEARVAALEENSHAPVPVVSPEEIPKPEEIRALAADECRRLTNGARVREIVQDEIAAFFVGVAQGLRP